NQEDYEIAKKKFYANEVFYIPGVGIDLKKFNPVNKNEKELLRKKLGYNKKDFILIYVGELSYRKNQKMLIESIRLLNNEINNIKLLLVGTGELKEKYEHLVNKLELENTVKFLGYRTDVKELMQISDLAVSTSRQEGLPVNIMEAMAVGLPLVVTDSRGNRDLVSDQYNGYIVPIDKAQKFSDKVREIYSENEKATKFSENNLKDIKLYSLENILVSMSQFYK